MKRVVALLLGAFVTVSNVSAKEDKAGYEDCVLEHVSGAEEVLAVNVITYACHRLYIDNFMLSDKDEAYFSCLLEYLPASKSEQVTHKIRNICYRRHLGLFEF